MAQKTFIVGRNPNVSQGEIPIQINDPTKKVSSNHCRITFDGANYFIEDLISTNGTFVNGQKIASKIIVNSNTLITLGRKYPFSTSQLQIQDTNSNSFTTTEKIVPDSNSNQDNQLYIKNSIAKNLPSMVKNELAKLSPNKQEEFMEEYKRNIKSVGIAYLLMFLIGMPYGYMKKWGLQIVYWLTGAGFVIWGIIVLFTLPSLIRDYNKDMAIEVMRNLKATSN
ncbi:MAG: FHA domain-containing protein [Flavobacteriaceae bacterium]|nr:FHA domain-containing protein [Flavobacteriaceae bacterium]